MVKCHITLLQWGYESELNELNSSLTLLDVCDNYADRIYVVIAITLVASALITCIPVYRVRCRWSALC